MSKPHSKLKVIPSLDGMEVLETRVVAKRFPVHFHETFVIQLVHSGTDWCCVNDLSATRGEVFVHFPMASHTGGSVNDNSLEYQAIYPSVGLFEEVTGISRCNVAVGSSAVISCETTAGSVRRLLSCLDSEGNEKELRKRLEQVFHNILRPISACKERANLNIESKLHSAKQYLIDNADRDVSVEELSNYCSVSKFHLIRSFKQRFGITPRRFLISQRVSLAKQLMLSGLPLAQAALSAGFNDQSHLARCFKRLTNVSPGQYRTATQRATD